MCGVVLCRDCGLYALRVGVVFSWCFFALWTVASVESHSSSNTQKKKTRKKKYVMVGSLRERYCVQVK